MWLEVVWGGVGRGEIHECCHRHPCDFNHFQRGLATQSKIRNGSRTQMLDLWFK